ncbi:MAG: zinc-ribbon domain-containing protein, partial [Coprobacillus cateniformis]
MYCRKCGAKMSDTARFCDSCGEEVKKVRQRSDTQKYEERKIEDAKQSKSKKSKHEKALEELK